MPLSLIHEEDLGALSELPWRKVMEGEFFIVFSCDMMQALQCQDTAANKKF